MKIDEENPRYSQSMMKRRNSLLENRIVNQLFHSIFLLMVLLWLFVESILALHVNNIISIRCKYYSWFQFIEFSFLFRCFFNHFDSILLLTIPIIVFICFLLIFLLLARQSLKNLPSPSSQLTNEISPILPSSDDNHEQLLSWNLNQLLSILSQLILLIFIFLSSLAIGFRPLHSLKLRFEYLIYSHCYGFFVIFLAFYILSYHVLARFRLIRRAYIHRIDNDEPDSIDNKESDVLSSTDQTSIVPLSSSHDLSQRYLCQSSPNMMMIDENSKRLTNVTSKYYVRHEEILKTNSSQSIPHVPAIREWISLKNDWERFRFFF